jgi:hypothetical protein
VRRPTALGDFDDYTQDRLYRSVNRLLHAGWYLTDPLVAPDDEVIDKLADELKTLATHHGRGNRVFTQAARHWPARLRSWRQDYESPT